MVSYHSAFAVGGGLPSQETMEKNILPSGYAGGSTIFLLPPISREKNQDFARCKVCVSHKPTPQASSQECIQMLDTDDATLSTPTVDYEYQPHVCRTK
jgi:hypothetical protein